jgi:hypothetical protein
MGRVFIEFIKKHRMLNFEVKKWLMAFGLWRNKFIELIKEIS